MMTLFPLLYFILNMVYFQDWYPSV